MKEQLRQELSSQQAKQAPRSTLQELEEGGQAGHTFKKKKLEKQKPLQEVMYLFFSELRISESQESREGQEVYGCLFSEESREPAGSDLNQGLRIKAGEG